MKVYTEREQGEGRNKEFVGKGNAIFIKGFSKPTFAEAFYETANNANQ